MSLLATDEMKKKALSSILLVGKGFSFENTAFFLQARIRSKLPSGLKKYSEQIDVTGKVRVSSVLFAYGCFYLLQ